MFWPLFLQICRLVENYHATFKPLRSVLTTNGAAIRRQWNTQITQPLVQRPLDHPKVDEVFYRNYNSILSGKVVLFFFYSLIAKCFILCISILSIYHILIFYPLFSHSCSYSYPVSSILFSSLPLESSAGVQLMTVNCYHLSKQLEV